MGDSASSDPFAPLPVTPGGHPGGEAGGAQVRTQRPPGSHRPGADPGGPFGGLLAWLLGGLVFLLVAGLQNFAPAPEVPAEQVSRMQSFGVPGILGRAAVRLSSLLEGMQEGSSGQVAVYVEEMALNAGSPAEHVAVSVVALEVVGPDAALERVEGARFALDEVESRALEARAEAEAAGETFQDEPAMVLAVAHARDDLDALEAMYIAVRDGDEGVPPAVLSDDRRTGLVDRLGYFGELASALDTGDAVVLDELRAGGAALLVFGLVVLLLGVGVVLASIVCFVLAIVMMRKWRLSMPVPKPGGSVFIESWAVFVVGFLVVILVGGALGAALNNNPIAVPLGMLLQWTLLIAAFWPLVRGMRWKDFKLASGFNTGEGLLKEFSLGVFAYVAFLPIYVLAVLFTFLLLVVYGMLAGGDAETPSNPVLDLIGSADWFTIIVLYTLATVWAPLVEELVFRGAMYRHLRARMGLWLAGPITGLAFAFMHGYGPLLTPPLLALAMLFVFLREWRGSLVAAIAAHWLHNTALVLLMIVAVSLLR